MGRLAKLPLRVAVMAVGVAGALMLLATGAFVAMVWTVWQVFMMPF